MQTGTLITDEDSDDIAQFLDDMESHADACERDKAGRLVDDTGRGAYFERNLFSGVTLVMDWAYLDAASTYLLVSSNAPGYDRDDAAFLENAGPLFDQLTAELADVLGCTDVQYDGGAYAPEKDVWHVHGVDPA